MNFLIIEDEPLVARDLEKLMRRLDENIRIVEVIGSVKEAVKWLQNNPSPQLIFSDIQLADGVCFDIYKSVTPDCPIIFTTAFDEYALRAFKLNSIGYLLKPIDFNELKDVYEKFLRYHQSPEVMDLFRKQFSLLLENVNNGKNTKTVLLCIMEMPLPL